MGTQNNEAPITPATEPVTENIDFSSAPAPVHKVSPRAYGAVASVIAVASLGLVAATTNPDAAPAYASVSADRFAINTSDPVFEYTYSVTVDGETTEYTTEATTWKAALAEAGVRYSKDDILNIQPSARPADGTDVVIDRVTYGNVTEETTQEFETVREDDPDLAKGSEETRTEGEDGLTRTNYRVRYVNGAEESRETAYTVVVTPKVDEVIAVGTKETPDPAPAASSNSGSSSSSSSSSSSAPAPAPAPVANVGGNRGIAQQMVANKGWPSSEFQCLNTLWNRESNWNHLAMNPSSGAYGIPQSLPGSKMASHGADWRTNPATQIAWGLDYIQGRYGTPCNALSHSYAVGWY